MAVHSALHRRLSHGIISSHDQQPHELRFVFIAICVLNFRHGFVLTFQHGTSLLRSFKLIFIGK